MAEIPTKEKPTREPKAPDLSALVDQTSRTLVDLDQRIQLMRQDLASMMQQATAQAPISSGPNWPSAGAWMHPGGAGQDPYATPSMQPWTVADPFAGRLPPIGTPYSQHSAQGQPQGYAGEGRTARIEPRPAPAGITSAAEAVAQHGAGALPGVGRAGSEEERSGRPPVACEPAGDILDLGQEFQIRLDMPGVKKDDLDIMVTDRSVIVTGEAHPDVSEGIIVFSERAPTQYRRTVTLPNDIQTSECHAKLKDGVLSIILPKKTPADGPRHINVAYA